MWRLLLSPPLDGADNMALDVALMGRARRTGETVLRVYEWARPTLSFGRHQRAAGAFDAGAIAEAGLDVVRRPTGGRTLLHDHEVTYSVTAPATDAPRHAYAAINALLMNALGALGVPVTEVAPTARSRRPGAAPCFASPAAGELVAGGAKLVGSAQWRDDGAMLQHGSILVEDDQRSIARLAAGADAEVAADVPAPATLRALLGRSPTATEVGERLRDAVRALADPDAEWLTLDDATAREAAEVAPRFRDAAWTWRR